MDLFIKTAVPLAIFLLAQRCGSNDMSLEGKCCWEKDNSGCLRVFDV